MQIGWILTTGEFTTIQNMQISPWQPSWICKLADFLTSAEKSIRGCMAILPNLIDSKNEISATKKVFISRITPKIFSAHLWGLSLSQTWNKSMKGFKALESDIGFWRPSWILLEKTEKHKKNYQANSPGPVCIPQIFGNNPGRGFWARAETKCGSLCKVNKSPPPHSILLPSDPLAVS